MLYLYEPLYVEFNSRITASLQMPFCLSFRHMGACSRYVSELSVLGDMSGWCQCWREVVALGEPSS